MVTGWERALQRRWRGSGKEDEGSEGEKREVARWAMEISVFTCQCIYHIDSIETHGNTPQLYCCDVSRDQLTKYLTHT
jgi:hypothetical protein